MFDLYADRTRQADDEAALNPSPGPPRSFGEAFDDAWDAQRAYQQAFSKLRAQQAVMGDVLDKFRQQTGEDLPNPYLFPEAPGDQAGPTKQTNFQRYMQQAQTRYEATRRDRPELALDPFPTPQDIDTRAVDRMTQARVQYERQLERDDHGVADFLGAAAGSMTDIVNLAPMAMGLGSPAATGIVRTALIEGTIGAGSQATVTGLNYQNRRQVDPAYGPEQAAFEITAAGAGGAVLGGGLKLLGKGLARLLDTADRPALPRSVNDAINVVRSDIRDAETTPFPTDAGANAAHQDTVANVAETLRTSDTAPIVVPPEVQALHEPVPPARKLLDDFIEPQRGQTFEQLHAKAVEFQPALAAEAQRIADEIGVSYKDPGPKDFETAFSKIARKGYEGPHNLTDMARGGFTVDSEAQADEIARRLSEHFTTLDEGWAVNSIGYFDRKVLVRADSGVIAEVQIFSRPIYEAKYKGGLGKIYDKERSLPEGAEKAALAQQMIDGYAAAVRGLPEWAGIFERSKGPKSGSNLARQAASDITPPDQWTSLASTETHGPPALSTAKAVEESGITAGRQSQFRNFTGDTSASDIAPGTPGGNASHDPMVTGIAATHLTEDAIRAAAKEPDAALAEIHAAEHLAEEAAADGKAIMVDAEDGRGPRDIRDILREADQEEAMATEIGNCVIGGAMPE